MALNISIRASTGESGLRIKPATFSSKLLQIGEETIESLKLIWNECGYEEIECHGLLGDLLNKLKLTCAAELAAEQQILDHAKEQIIQKLTYYNEACSKLGRSGIDESELGTNYSIKFSNLEKFITTIDVEINQRQSLLDIEYSQIESICIEMGEIIPTMDSFEAPNGLPELSDARLEVLKAGVESWKKRKAARIEQVKSLATECCEVMKEMEINSEGWDTLPSSTIYNFSLLNKELTQYLKTSKFLFGISKNDAELFQNRVSSLKEEKLRRKEELTKTGAEIARLWTLLRIPTTERESFQKSIKMNISMETLSKGRDEYERLLNVRQTSLQRIITSIRTDILSLWTEIFIESEDARRQEFSLYFDDIMTLEDNAVEIHEAYYNKLKTRAEELRPILAKIARRENVIQERIELEHIQLNPERLIARGPNAREERKREEGMTVRVKNLEKITRELLGQISTWEEHYGPFYYLEERYFDRILKQEEQYQELKETLRNSRKKGSNAPKVPEVPAKANAMRKTVNLGATVKAKESLVATSEFYQNDENYGHINSERHSTDSDATEYTSVTEVRDRPSTASNFTIIKNNQYI